MSRQSAPVEVNKFIGGLITDASPLTFPENASLDEENFILNNDGSRNRRYGMDLEENYAVIDTGIPLGDTEVAISSFKWKNAGGDPQKSILVTQVGNQLKFFDLDAIPISTRLIYTYNFSVSLDQNFSYAVVDGILVVTSGINTPLTFEYLDSVITPSTIVLKIRDLFGVEDVVGSVDLNLDNNVNIRPTSANDAHIYNLRNQSWGIPRINGNGDGNPNSGISPPKGSAVEDLYNTPNPSDPIYDFYSWPGNVFPSNSDSVTQSLYPNTNNKSNRTVERFFVEDLIKNPIGTFKAANGYFIIDALDRGSSRHSSAYQNKINYPTLIYDVTSLPLDRTPGGPTTISEFAGRMFYSGFPGEVIGGDKLSPRMSSYILFSQVVDSLADLGQCYQEADPTSKDDPNIVDTDGGFIRINEAYGIKKLINLGSSLLVIASNGVWRIVGGSDTGFTATKYIVEKITDHGCSSVDSIVFIDNTIMFWGDDALYHVKTDQFGTWVAENISTNRIQKLFNDIKLEDKARVKGSYDSFDRKIRWLFKNRLLSSDEVMELVLDINLQAYCINRIKNLDFNSPKVMAYYIGEPYQVTTNEEIITTVGSNVTVLGATVTITSENRGGISKKEIGYITVLSTSPTIKYSFSTYRNLNFMDWEAYDGTGIDAEAFLVTGYLSGGDFQRDKQVLYLVAHLRRTETGYYDNGGELFPLNPSSCILQSQWNWANSGNSNKWSRPFQAYRYKVANLPVDVTDDYNTGFATISTRNKMRGNGRVVSFKFSTEAKKNLHLYGWSMIINVADND